MSIDKLTDAMGGIGDDLIVEAKQHRGGILLRPWIIAAEAACLVLLIGALLLAWPKDEAPDDETVLQNNTVSVEKPSVTPSDPNTQFTTAPTIAPSTVPTVKPSQAPNTQPTVSSTDDPATVHPTTNYPSTTPSTVRPNPSSTTVATSTSNENPFEYPPLVIWDGETYNQLFAAAEDVSVFAQNQDFVKTFGNPEELKLFLNKLNQLPIPQAEGAVCNILEYIPDYQMLNIGLQTPNGVGYSFTFELNPDRADEICESFANRNMLIEQEWTAQGCETFKTVTEFKLLSTIFPGRYGCWVEIDGWLANFTGTNLPNNAEFDDILTQLSFGDTLYWG